MLSIRSMFNASLHYLGHSLGFGPFTRGLEPICSRLVTSGLLSSVLKLGFFFRCHPLFRTPRLTVLHTMNCKIQGLLCAILVVPCLNPEAVLDHYSSHVCLRKDPTPELYHRPFLPSSKATLELVLVSPLPSSAQTWPSLSELAHLTLHHLKIQTP
jgi:hypothetical protein